MTDKFDTAARTAAIRKSVKQRTHSEFAQAQTVVLQEAIEFLASQTEHCDALEAQRILAKLFNALGEMSVFFNIPMREVRITADSYLNEEKK